jgi:DNA-binding NtrC family response regulator
VPTPFPNIQEVADALARAGLDTVPLEVLEQAAIRNALEEFGGCRTHAALSLGISVRTLQRKLKKIESCETYVEVGNSHLSAACADRLTAR